MVHCCCFGDVVGSLLLLSLFMTSENGLSKLRARNAFLPVRRSQADKSSCIHGMYSNSLTAVDHNWEVRERDQLRL